MDLQALRFFRAIATEGNLSKAAQKLNYAQSNLSTKISQLERELGAELFVRYNHGVTLTPKGEQLLQYAVTLLDLAEETEKALKDNGTAKGNLNIGSMQSTATTFLPGLLATYHRNNPNVTLCIKTGSTEASLRDVLDHSLDGAFVAGPVRHPGLGVQVVEQERLVLISARTDAEETPAAALLRQPLLVFPQGCSYRKVLERWLDSEGLLAEKIMEFNSLSAIIASVSAGLGVSIFPEAVVHTYAASGALSCHPLPEQYAKIPTVFVYRKDGYMESSLRKFLGIIEKPEKIR